MKKVINDKIFKVSETAEIRCSWFATRYGFKHEAELYDNGRFVNKAKVCYYNRTWESFEYETVISNLLHKIILLTQDERRAFMDRCRKGYHEEVQANFGMIAGLMRMGDLLCDNKEDQNKFKSRMMRAGLESKGLIIPDDFDTWDEEKKEAVLNGLIGQLEKPLL